MPYATTFWLRFQACVRSRSHLAAIATVPTIWCRKRCCGHLPISTRSSPARTCRPGCSRSCATRSDYRKRRREVEDAEGNYAKTLKTQPSQGAHLEFEEFRAALDKLPQDQREALILVGASGFSYEDAATICGCAVGTIKSRVNRARSKLAALLYVDGAEDFGPDETVRAVIGGNG